jgi:hypothetical protein
VSCEIARYQHERAARIAARWHEKHRGHDVLLVEDTATLTTSATPDNPAGERTRPYKPLTQGSFHCQHPLKSRGETYETRQQRHQYRPHSGLAKPGPRATRFFWVAP